MAEVSAEQLLLKIEQAISAILEGAPVQSYRVGGTDVQRMNLSELLQWREKLRAEVNSATYGHRARVAMR